MRVLVTQTIDAAGLRVLVDAGLDVDQWQHGVPMSHDELLDRIGGADAVVSMPTDRIDAEVLDAAPELKVVANHAVGYDNVDVEAARARGVTVTNTPGVLTAATADLTMALLLAASRHVVAADRFVRSGQFLGWRPTMYRGLDLDGAVLGIVGMGRIGRAVAHRAAAFGMRVEHSSRSSGVPLSDLLGRADVVSLHCPLDDQTRHLIDADALARMKPSAVLVNTSRGPVVDEAALAAALASGRLAAAGLDVFEDEPAVHPDLLELDNVVLLPHLGSATWRTRRAMARKAALNAVAVLQGHGPLDPV